MDKKTRVLHCIDNKPVDRIPMSFWHHYHGDDAEGKTCIAAHRKLYEETGIDFVKMMSDGFFPVDFGLSRIENPADWARVAIPSDHSAWVQGQIDRVLWMREAIRDEACVFYVMFSAFELLCQVFGYDVCVNHLKDPVSRRFMQPIFDALGDLVAETSGRIITEGGATGIHQAMANSFRFTADEYRLLMRPQDLKIMEATNRVGRYNIVHLCGWAGIRNNLEVWRDYEGAIMHWDQHTDHLPIGRARGYFTGSRALMAGFDNKPGTFLYTADKPAVKEMAKSYAREGGDTGFLLSADCSLDESFPYERIRWVGEALEELASE